jgi:catechol 2,3-dioxygenase-like lactoylglutathione lyase family enzyme
VEEELRAELQERHGRSDRAAEARGRADHDRELEPVVVPVTDMDRAKHFYGEQLGFVVGHDTRVGDEMRVVQLSPPGSVEGLQLAVPDLDAARARLVEQGVEVSQIQHYEGPTGGPDRVDGRGGCWNSFVFFGDPDGNQWAIRSARRVACKLHRSSRAWRNRQTRRV